MKDPVKHLRKTIMVAIIFLIVYAAVMLFVERRHNDELIMADSINKTESVRGMIEGYGKTADENEFQSMEKLRNETTDCGR